MVIPCPGKNYQYVLLRYLVRASTTYQADGTCYCCGGRSGRPPTRENPSYPTRDVSLQCWPHRVICLSLVFFQPQELPGPLIPSRGWLFFCSPVAQPYCSWENRHWAWLCHCLVQPPRPPSSWFPCNLWVGVPLYVGPSAAGASLPQRLHVFFSAHWAILSMWPFSSYPRPSTYFFKAMRLEALFLICVVIS